MSPVAVPNTGYGHWDVSMVGEFDVNKHVGFVYRITNLKSGRAYIGCKHFWRFKKRKKVAASEWRTYCSSSDYLKPDIQSLGKEAFSFEILMLCNNRRNLYYNEMRLQIELGVLESNDYYNANIGGMRFFRPVVSYLDDAFRAKLRAKKLGTLNPNYRGTFRVKRKDGSEQIVSDMTMDAWCKENGFNRTRIYEVRIGTRKSYKGIVELTYEQ